MIEHDDIIVVNPHSTNGVTIYLQTTIGVLAKIYDFPHYHYHHHQRIIQSVNINFGSEPAGFLFPFSLLNRFPTYQHCWGRIITNGKHKERMVHNQSEGLTWFKLLCGVVLPKLSKKSQLHPRSQSSDRKGFLSGLHSHFSVLFFQISFQSLCVVEAGGRSESARASEAVAGRQLTVRTVRNCGRGGGEGGWLLAPSGFTTGGSALLHQDRWPSAFWAAEASESPLAPPTSITLLGQFSNSISLFNQFN